MVNSVAAGQSSQYYNRYDSLYGVQSTRPSLSRAVGIPAAQPEVPVQPVTPAPPVVPAQSSPLNRTNLLSQYESDPIAMAVRGRIQYGGNPAAQTGGTAQAIQNGEEAAEAAGQVQGAKSPQEVMEEAECPTCAQRKYQDGSDDPGVSFKTAGHIDPDQAHAVVRGHEQEHVVREQAKAAREDRKVVSQSVTMHTAICPDCGRAYVSGGTTRTVTKAIADPVERQQQAQEAQQNPFGFSAVA